MKKYWKKIVVKFFTLFDYFNVLPYYKLISQKDVLDKDVFLYVPLRRLKKAIRSKSRKCKDSTIFDFSSMLLFIKYKIYYNNKIYIFQRKVDSFVLIVNYRILFNIKTKDDKYIGYEKEYCLVDVKTFNEFMLLGFDKHGFNNRKYFWKDELLK